MLGEIPYMIVWGFFSALGWMLANYSIDKVYPPDKPPAQEVKVEERTAPNEEVKPKPK